MTQISGKKLMEMRKKTPAIDIWLLYIEECVPEEKKKEYIKWLMRTIKMKPEKVADFVQNLVGNLCMNLPDQYVVVELVNTNDTEWLLDKIAKSLPRRSSGKTVEEWIKIYKPIVSGYLEHAYILWAVYMFRPEIYKLLKNEFPDGEGVQWLFKNVDQVQEYLGIVERYTIQPSMFVGKKRK